MAGAKFSATSAVRSEAGRPLQLVCRPMFNRAVSPCRLSYASRTTGDMSPVTAPSILSFQHGRNPFQISPSLHPPQPKKRAMSYTEEHRKRKECEQIQAKRDSETVELMRKKGRKSVPVSGKVSGKEELLAVRRRHLLWSQGSRGA